MPTLTPDTWPSTTVRHRGRLSTATGHLHDLSDPEGAIIVDEDVWTSGSRQCRYAGSLDANLLDHWCHATMLAVRTYPDRVGLHAYVACHDLHEATVLDLPRGLKDLVASVYDPLEARWAAAYHRHYGLGWPVPPLIAPFVKEIDCRAALAEAHALTYPGHPIRQYFADLYSGGQPPPPWEVDLYQDVRRLGTAAKWIIVRDAMAIVTAKGREHRPRCGASC